MKILSHIKKKVWMTENLRNLLNAKKTPVSDYIPD